MRGNRKNGIKPNHIVSAWSKEDGFCLGQKSVGEKSNEIIVTPELLKKLQVKRQVVTIDAMETQTAIAEKIKGKRADYVLSVKGNQGTLYESLREYFAEKEFRNRIKESGNYKRSKEKAHGQIETREYYQTEDVKWLEQRKNWKCLNSIIMERKTIEKAGKKETEYRYFATSYTNQALS